MCAHAVESVIAQSSRISHEISKFHHVTKTNIDRNTWSSNNMGTLIGVIVVNKNE